MLVNFLAATTMTPYSSFQFTVSQRDWPISCLLWHNQKGISTLKEADLHVLEEISTDQYFNSQPLKEADGYYQWVWQQHYISTHSLSRRLTSIWAIIFGIILHFNSQPHKEADLLERLFVNRAIDISTHSLSRRLTNAIFGCTPSFSISTHSLTRRLTFRNFFIFIC